MKKMKNMADDVWFEIFLHLPLADIFKFKCVSKVWFSILSSPNFINKWYELNYSSLPWALFDYAIDCSPHTNKLRRNFTIAYPDSHSQFINDHQNEFSFNFLNPNCPNRGGLYIRSSSNGLVLCIQLLKQKTIYVCNPLTQKLVFLPQPPTEEGMWVAGLICNESFSSSLISMSYKVIHIPRFKAAAEEIKVEVFCSDLGEWNTYGVSRPPNLTWRIDDYHDRLIAHNGLLYWFQKEDNKILAFSVNGNSGVECRVINLPYRVMDAAQESMNQCIGESEGSICYANIVKKDTERSLGVWVLEEDWYLLHKDVRFNDMLALMESQLVGGATRNSIAGTRVIGFNPFDKNVVILGCRDNVLAYNTRTRAYEQLYHPSFKCSIDFGLLTVAFKPRPTILPPLSCRGTSTVDGNKYETDN